ncbi:MAG: magnesium/cobalt transporter CorA [Chloroflexota bacterium]
MVFNLSRLTNLNSNFQGSAETESSNRWLRLWQPAARTNRWTPIALKERRKNGADRVESARPRPKVDVLKHGELTWINIERPSQTEIDWLRENFPFFHPVDLDDCLTRVQRPKINEYEDYLFLVLHFPVFSRADRQLGASEVDMLVGTDYLITLHKGDLSPIATMFEECRGDEARRAEHMGRGSAFLLYQLVDHLVDYCFPILDKMGANVDSAEDRIFGVEVREVIHDLSLARRDVIAFRRIVKPEMTIIASLERKETPFLGEELGAYWGNVSDHVNKIWDVLEDYREVIEGLAATSESINSLRMNEVMKVLTLISTIMLPMAVISGIYGMNIDFLPFAHHPLSFVITVGVMATVLVSMVAYFRLRRWV